MAWQYYVNKNVQPNGFRDVHVYGCTYLPHVESRIHLGAFNSCQPAVIEAGRYYAQVNGCYHCCNACHTQ